MTEDLMTKAGTAESTAAKARERLLREHTGPRAENRSAAGVSTAILEGGSGEPLLLPTVGGETRSSGCRCWRHSPRR